MPDGLFATTRYDGGVQLRATLFFALGLASLAHSSIANADEGPVPIDLPHAIARGAEHGPGVAIAAAPRRALVSAREASRAFLTIPPRLTVQSGPRFVGGGAGLEIGATLLQDIPLRAVGGARTGVADALLGYTDASVARARLDAMLRSGLAWVGAREATEILTLRRASLADARELLRVMRARGTAGTVTPSDVASADAEVALAAAGELDAEGALVEASAELHFALAVDEELLPVGDLAVTDDTPSDDGRAKQLAVERNPSVTVARTRTLTAERDATLAHALMAPTISVGASVVREGNGENVVQGIFSFPLPFARPGAFEGARARAQADTEVQTEELEKAQVRRDVALALHERLHTRELRAVLLGALAPLREAERLARITLDAGTNDITALLLARARRLTTGERSIRAMADVYRADLRFGRAIGQIPWRQP